ncbi:MAG: efflux transporter outer membrane subunit [Bacteroidales bacterium]|nr:efflux transporter outer membrane subunit [Bacteroidales bacterium]
MTILKMNIFKSILFSISLSIAVTGCMVGPNLEKPVAEVEDQFRFDSIANDSMINLAWWQMYNDPMLDTLIYMALERNRDVLIAISRIEQAYAVLGVSRADLFPQFGYDASATYGKPDPAGTSDPGALFTITPSVYWELDFWGKVRRSNQAARAEIAASEEALRLVQVSLIAAVADGYFQLLDYDKRLEISRRTWETRKESLWIIEQRFLKGIVPEIDLNQAQQQEAVAAVAVPVYERNVARTENYLSILIGQNPRNIKRCMLDDRVLPPEVPVGIPSELLLRRPDIIQAEQVFYAETARIGVAQAMRFPSFSITGALGVASSDLSSLVSGDALIYSIGGSVLGPVFNWGKNKRRVEIQQEVAEQALYRYEQSVLNAFREVDDALIDLQTYGAESESRQRQKKAAINAAMLSRARYDGGQTGYLEVLDTERSMFSAELEATASRRNHLSSYIYLYKALGGGWITPADQP